MPVLIANDSDAGVLSGQRQIFKDVNGVLWKFYSDQTNMVYRTSSDNGSTWSAKTTVKAAVLSSMFAVWYDSAFHPYVWYVHGQDVADTPLVMCRGTISGTSITWGTEYTVAVASLILIYSYPVIIVLSDASLQVYASRGTGATRFWYLWTNPNNDGSGTWTAYGSVSTESAAVAWMGASTPLLSAKAYSCYQIVGGGTIYGRRWNGSSLDAEATITGVTPSGIGGLGLGSDGDVTYVSWYCPDRISDWTYHPNIQFRRINADNTLGSLQQISADDDAEAAPDLSIDAVNHVVFVVWGQSNVFKFRVFRNGVWETEQLWPTGQTYVSEASNSVTWRMQTQNQIPMTYTQGELPPYNLFFNLFDITPPPLPPVLVKMPTKKIDLGPHPRSRLLFNRTLYLKGVPPLWDSWDYLWVAVL